MPQAGLGPKIPLNLIRRGQYCRCTDHTLGSLRRVYLPGSELSASTTTCVLITPPPPQAHARARTHTHTHTHTDTHTHLVPPSLDILAYKKDFQPNSTLSKLTLSCPPKLYLPCMVTVSVNQSGHSNQARPCPEAKIGQSFKKPLPKCPGTCPIPLPGNSSPLQRTPSLLFRGLV